jgi:hypothetical protein
MSEEKERRFIDQVSFECELRVESRKEMQAAGRTVFGLYRENPDPNAPDIRRDWGGDTVYDLRLMLAGVQVLRVMSDSIEDADRLMSNAIQNQFAAWARQDACISFDRSQYDRLMQDERDLAQFVEFNYRSEIQAGEHAQFPSLKETIMHYLSIERGRRGVKIKKLLGRGKK